MSLHFQVIVEFSSFANKRQLVKPSIFLTYSACTSIPFWPYEKTFLAISCIFSTLQNAKSYIAYLHEVYSDSPAPPPVIDGGQQELFSEGENEY